MISSKPYLIRAINEWLLDNSLTPYLAVDTSYAEVDVPKKYILNGKIILNISPNASSDLHIDNAAITFKARFEGISRDIYVPTIAVLAIYAHENNQGLVFPHEEESADHSINSHDLTHGHDVTNVAPHKRSVKSKQQQGKPQLTLVKRNSDSLSE